MVRIFSRSAFLALACLFVFPFAASAQSVIAGEVRDQSGGLLPGVTVEVSSPALIEKVRSVTTDDRGQYRVVDLRPGTYTVTFTLEGFTTLKREGVDLPSSFTATVNGDLQVGSLQETLTVSGQAPTVDVQQVARSTVLSRALIDDLPTTRNMFSVGQLVAGLRQAVPDVGGSRLMEQTNIFGHGVNGRNTAYFLDGLRINANKSEGGIIQYQNDALNQDVVVTTSGSPAEIGVAGVAINSIPKDGGNTFSGGTFLSYSSGKWMGDNVNDDLRKRGIRTGNNISRVDNDQVSEGGPILRNRLWIFTAGGFTKADENVANTPLKITLPDGSTYVTTNSQWVSNVLVRLTSQATPRNKLAVFAQRTFKKKDREFTSGQDPYYTAQVRPNKNQMYSIGEAKWTSTVSSRLLLDAGFATNTIFYRIESQPFAYFPKYLPDGKINPAWIGNARINDTAQNPHPGCLLPEGCTTARTWGQSQGSARANTYAANATYVTGSHSFKAGISLWRGPYRRQVQRQADLDENYVNGVPQTVTVYNTPIDHEEFLDYSLGYFVQDSWKLKRLTVNPGLRMESFSSSIKQAGLPEGRFRQGIVFPALTNMPPNWKHDFAPRLSAAYDLFGDGKTAVKASIGKYFQTYITAFAATYSPAPQVSETRNWFDADLIPGTSTRSGLNLPTNNDSIAQDNEIGPSGNPDFGLKGADRTFDPNIRKTYSWETTASVQRELFRGVSAGVEYIHRIYGNLVTTDRTLIALSDYTSFQLAVPDVSRDPDVAAVINPSEIITIYNLNAAKRSVFGAKLYDRLSDGSLGNGGQDQSIYNGFETSFSARVKNGAVVTGNWTTERNVTVFCDTNDDPNGVTESDLYSGTSVSRGGRFCDQRKFDMPFRHEFKIAGNYPLPFNVSVAAALQSYAGLPRVITWQPAANQFPGGRTNSETIILNKPGSLFYPRYNQVDVNVKKTFRYGNKRLTAQLDFFNVFNAGVILTENNAVGASLGQVTAILQGRMPRLNFRMEW